MLDELDLARAPDLLGLPEQQLGVGEFSVRQGGADLVHALPRRDHQ
ncbi:hypothetical protein [Streptomyces sp. Ncost-T10-10d]|nr:hypothetical protein [Streptomyces sp. Ncost-T10-10d]